MEFFPPERKVDLTFKKINVIHHIDEQNNKNHTNNSDIEKKFDKIQNLFLTLKFQQIRDRRFPQLNEVHLQKNPTSS